MVRPHKPYKKRVIPVAQDVHVPDTGCEISPRCYDCPLTTDKGKYLCMKDIRNGTRSLLGQRDAILSAFNDCDRGVTKEEIAKRYDVSLFTVIGWITDREHINNVFKTYAKAIPYLKPYVNPYVKMAATTIPN